MATESKITKLYLNHTDIYNLMLKLKDDLLNWTQKYFPNITRPLALYGIPRGGIPVVYYLMNFLPKDKFDIVDDPVNADFFIDDLIDSGRTMESYLTNYRNSIAFLTLIDKLNPKSKYKNEWICFPWEVPIEKDKDTSANDIGLRLLQRIGEDPNRDGLKDTPARYIKAWDELTVGYKQSAKEILSTTFENTEHYDEMVILKDIEFYSMCEHHLLPFFGSVHIAYIPNTGNSEYLGKDLKSGQAVVNENIKPGKIVGLSKLARLVEMYARRLQTQERLTEEIARALEKYLEPLGVAVYVEARHFCMVARGVSKQNSVMVTSSLKGNLRKESARMESLMLIKR